MTCARRLFRCLDSCVGVGCCTTTTGLVPAHVEDETMTSRKNLSLRGVSRGTINSFIPS